MKKKRRKRRVTNQNQLDWLAEIRRAKGKRKQPKERGTNIDHLFWLIAQERKKRGAKNATIQTAV